uniref:DUF4274 domain-containing protein n=1 Tax=Rhodopseudomonas palustris (strain BisA53) TaxID=316055 RepID=Q07P56_RHOP5
MSGDGTRNQSRSNDSLGLSAENIATYRGLVRNSVMIEALSGRPGFPPFQGLSWDYFLDDVQMEARAARIKMRDLTVGSICDTIDELPPTAVVRLLAARFVYFSPLNPENEKHADYLLQPLDAATKKQMRQRRHAVHAIQDAENKQEEARKAAAAQDAALESQYWQCPHVALSTEPEDFLRWIKVQTPDTWHVIVQNWDYNSAYRDDVIEWVLDQPNCDVGTASQFFFTAAIGLADEDPEKLSSGYRRKWQLMKHVAENWQRGFYVRNELKHEVEPSDVRCYDELVARREAAGRPLPWKVPGREARRFGSRLPNSEYCYEPGHLTLTFAAWKRHRERSGCCKDFPHCCKG